MKIAFVTSEVAPFAKTGGLADVSGALPVELAKKGNDIKVFLPAYDSIKSKNFDLKKIDVFNHINVRVGENTYTIELYELEDTNNKLTYYFIGNSTFFDRNAIYTDSYDENQRFIFFQKAVIELIQNLKWSPDIVHCNDWQTGLMPMLLKHNYSWDRMFDKTATIFTIHNIGYQGVFAKDTIHYAEIPSEYYNPGGACEFYGNISFLKTSICLADIITTVSPTYAKEIMTEEFGSGMQGILQTRVDDLYGIINGVDYNIWNPELDDLIPYKYSINNLEGKLKNKKVLLEKINLPYNKDVPVIGIVSRIVSQKGFDIFVDAVKYLKELKVQWVILGKGDYYYENKLIEVAKLYPNNISVNLHYDDAFAHLIEAGADIFLMPSKYEPCGLNQIYSLKYGTIPVVRRTGGLADTIKDWDENYFNNQSGCGFVFDGYHGYLLYYAVKRAVSSFNNKNYWSKLIKNAMNCDYSWGKSAESYLKLYEQALNKVRK